MNGHNSPRRPRGHSGGLEPIHWLVLAGLLVLPGLTAHRFAAGIDGWLLAVVGLVPSLLAFGLHWADKRRADSGAWRTPEGMLHLTELFGGWPGAFLAQRQFRHKVSKPAYQALFWSIVVLHQVVAFDLLRGGPWMRAAGEAVRP